MDNLKDVYEDEFKNRPAAPPTAPAYPPPTVRAERAAPRPSPRQKAAAAARQRAAEQTAAAGYKAAATAQGRIQAAVAAKQQGAQRRAATKQQAAQRRADAAAAAAAARQYAAALKSEAASERQPSIGDTFDRRQSTSQRRTPRGVFKLEEALSSTRQGQANGALGVTAAANGKPYSLEDALAEM